VNLTVAGLMATTISYLLFITLAIQFVGPWPSNRGEFDLERDRA
jgi:nicotinamide riboside transporter PnuC